jgi:hypothetical protein
VYPRFSRATLAAVIGAWSLYSCFQAESVLDYFPVAGLYIAYRFAKYDGPSEDKKSAKAYNVSLIMFWIFVFLC